LIHLFITGVSRLKERGGAFWVLIPIDSSKAERPERRRWRVSVASSEGKNYLTSKQLYALLKNCRLATFLETSEGIM